MAEPTRGPVSPGPGRAPQASGPTPASPSPSARDGVGVTRVRAKADGFYPPGPGPYDSTHCRYIKKGTVFAKRADEPFASWMEAADTPRRRAGAQPPPTPRTRLQAPAISPKSAPDLEPEPPAEPGEEEA